MADFQSLLDAVALIVGGTAPDLTNKPGFYSGYIVGDSTGITNIHGAYSRVPEVVEEPPVCIVLPGSFTAKLGRIEENRDRLRLLILVARNDVPSQWNTLTPFRDTFPTTFRTNMSLQSTANVLQVFITDGKAGTYTWAGTEYLSWDMTLEVLRTPIEVYSN